MFYFLLAPALAYNGILILAAIIPAVILMIRVYMSDRLEKESPGLLLRLVALGVLSSLLALLEERIASTILDNTVPQSSVAYNIILYFIIVAGAEESSKYLFMRLRTWKNPEFNCQYDGVVYAVFVSLGFALWENISYVMMFGFSAALIRAVTAIPGHACFGVFMGIFYGIARRYENEGNHSRSVLFRVLSVIIPAALHGAYDYIASVNVPGSGWFFVIFVGALFVISFILVGRMSKKDKFI